MADDTSQRRRFGCAPFFALLIILGVAGRILEGFGSNVADAAIPIIFVAFVAFTVLRSVIRASRSATGGSAPKQSTAQQSPPASPVRTRPTPAATQRDSRVPSIRPPEDQSDVVPPAPATTSTPRFEANPASRSSSGTADSTESLKRKLAESVREMKERQDAMQEESDVPLTSAEMIARAKRRITDWDETHRDSSR